MNSKVSSKESLLTPEDHPIAHVLVEEVPNSQNPQNTENEYNPFISQSQHLSQPGPSNQASQSLIELTAETAPVRRKRGRPTRLSTLHLKPTRGSQRSRKCPKVLKYESFKDSSWQWSESDKTLFLSACMEVGIEDIDGLKKCLPHKSEYDIRNQIAIWKELARSRVEKCLANDEDILGVKPETLRNLDEWINLFKEKAKTSDASMLIMSNYFSLYAEFGEFPSPEECGGIDYRAMYYFLHCMMNGIPPCGLNRVTAEVLLTHIDNILERLENPNMINSLEDHLFNQPTRPDQWEERFGKTYSRKATNNAAKPIDQILNNPIMNSLNLPENAIIKILEEWNDSDED